MNIRRANQLRPAGLPAVAALLIGAGVALTGCGGSSAEESAGPGNADASKGPDGPYKIVCTIGMITDVVRHVAGDHAKVEGLMGAGVDPHLYQPTRNDVAKLREADVVFYNGLFLEGKMGDIFVRLAREGKPVYAVTEMLGDEFIMTESEGLYDPHVWMDVGGWMKAVDAVAGALSEFDAAHAERYRSNAERYPARLTALDRDVHEVIGSIPRKSRVLVTAHDAFNYFGRAYDIEVRGIQGLSTDAEAGVKDINNLVDMLVERDIGAVFVETSVSDKNVEALIEGARSRGHEVVKGGSLFSDAMGRPGTYRGTYIGMIDHNATTIARALDGEAPEKGMNGKLAPRDGEQ